MILLSSWVIALGLADLIRGPGDSRRPQRREWAAITAGSMVLAVMVVSLGEPLWRGAVWSVASAGALWLYFLLRRINKGSFMTQLCLPAAWVVCITLGLMVPVANDATAPYSALNAVLVTNRWIAAARLDSGELLFAVACGLALTASGNNLVRGVLLATGVKLASAEGELRGGRWIGPLERLLIFGFTLAGDLTGAALVASAKSLLRFPELSREPSPKLHVVTEYFLIGSLSSWLLALVLAGLVKLAIS